MVALRRSASKTVSEPKNAAKGGGARCEKMQYYTAPRQFCTAGGSCNGKQNEAYNERQVIQDANEYTTA